ncbi:hypothetical protein Droror1_Dr00024150 [Drosera rotundifolia]
MAGAKDGEDGVNGITSRLLRRKQDNDPIGDYANGDVVGAVSRPGDSSITAALVFSIFVAVCGSFAYGCAAGYTSPAQEEIMSDLSLSTAEPFDLRERDRLDLFLPNPRKEKKENQIRSRRRLLRSVAAAVPRRSPSSAIANPTPTPPTPLCLFARFPSKRSHEDDYSMKTMTTISGLA